MANDDWALRLDLQEKNLAALNNLKIDGEALIPAPPVPASEYSSQRGQDEDDDEPEPNPADISLMQKLEMADDDWGLCADLQEKSLIALNNLKIDGEAPIPPPVPASEYSPQQDQNEDDDEPEPNPADISLMQKIMADDDWGLRLDLQEKNLAALNNLKIDGEGLIPAPPVPASEYSSQRGQDEDDDEPEPNPADISLMQKLVRTHLVETIADLEIQKRDPNSPLYSEKSFEGLNLRPELLKGVYGIGFNSHKITRKSTTYSYSRSSTESDCSGTGKTAASFLSALNRVDPNLHYPHVLVLSPKYELAVQTRIVAIKMAQFCPNIKFRFAKRGENLKIDHHITEQFLIGTPGKVFDWPFVTEF
ncbi:unnamed protein product [Larinioides sclopetarius]|uniref:DEAD/DEAH-box helicase domain-containing protein n=1 Tax=Larinioides sclopetarius TaxID=280406 RepID=A0AAV2BFI0_9ARAC